MLKEHAIKLDTDFVGMSSNTCCFPRESQARGSPWCQLVQDRPYQSAKGICEDKDGPETHVYTVVGIFGGILYKQVL